MAGAALKEIQEELQHDFDRKAIEYEQRGELKNSREMLLEAVSEKFGAVSSGLVKRISAIESHETLKILFKQVFRASSLEEFKEQVNRATDN